MKLRFELPQAHTLPLHPNERDAKPAIEVLYNQPMECKTCHRDIPDDAAFCPHCAENQDGKSNAKAFDYAAFISYRHLPYDTKVAKRVQRAIETYTFPIGVSGKPTNRRLGKCFRDEDELAASHSLPDRILDALSKSSSLIVVCTPNTQESIWVQREVEAFVKMHGQERVFAVLAAGSSAESIPEYLRPQASKRGLFDESQSSPLAADMRPEASVKARDEMLRLIAAIAECTFDDLKQRDRTRRRKKNAITAAAFALVAVLVVSALAFALSAHQDSLAANSRKLAVESAELLARGDRYGALEKALEALPKSESSNDRPYVPEARAALENALEIGDGGDALWLASYEITTDAPLGLIENSNAHRVGIEEEHASAIAVSDSGEYFAISDSDGNVGTYDTLTGRKLANCPMPKEAAPLADGLYVRSMGATEHYLLVGNGGDDGLVACFEAKTGKHMRTSLGTGCPSFNASYGADLISMCTPLSDAGYGVVIADLESGRSSSAEYRDEKVLSTAATCLNTSGSRLGTNFSTFGDRLFCSEVDTKTNKSVALAYPRATSLAYIDGLAIAASAEAVPADSTTRRFAIEAFDEELTLKWRYEGSFSSEMIEDSGIQTLLMGEPIISEPRGNSLAVPIRVGRNVLLFDSKTGDLLNALSFDRTVIDLATHTAENGSIDTIVATCSNGTISTIDLFEDSPDAEGDGRRLVLPFPLRWAHVTSCDDYVVLLAVPANAENRIVSFRTDWLRDDGDNTEYSLDELIGQANRVLHEGGKR